MQIVHKVHYENIKYSKWGNSIVSYECKYVGNMNIFS